MKISKGLILDLCKIAAILILILCIVLWYNQKPNFSKYHSYAVAIYDKDLGDYKQIPLTDEQFQQIANGYVNEETLRVRGLLDDAQRNGFMLYLYKSDDMSGQPDAMWTDALAGTYAEMCLFINDRAFRFDRSKPINIANKIIKEAIEQSESEQEV